MSGPGLYVVEVREDIAQALAGHDGSMYVSRPQMAHVKTSGATQSLAGNAA